MAGGGLTTYFYVKQGLITTAAIPLLPPTFWDRGGTVVTVLCYKSEGRWFDPTWGHWNFSLT